MLWEAENHGPLEKVQEYTEESKELEKKLLPYDVLGNIAHVKMLEKQGYLAAKELEEIEEELQKLYRKGTGTEIEKYEDIHTFIEEKVTEETEAGKKIHTGRSRNDQVAVDTRLYIKDAAIELALGTVELVKTLEKFAEEKNELVPGYTHQQQAMPSSTGLWASSFADSLIDDLKLLKGVFKTLDSCPLGAAASYGTSLDIDREYTAELLGFTRVQENPIYASGGRGKHELMLLNVLKHVMFDIQKLSEDLINFSEDQQIFELPDDYTTGSSIMPQKKNPDVLELARGKAEEVKAQEQAISSIISKLPSGYNRDTQLTKKHLMKGVETALGTVGIITELIEGLEPSDDFEFKDGIFAAYTANQKVEDEKAFRDAYHEVKKNQDYEKTGKVKTPEMQDYQTLEEFWQQEKQGFEEVKDELINSTR